MREPYWPTLDSGKLRTRVVLLEQAIVSDASGESPVYAAGSPPVSTMAEVEYLRGTDAIRNGQDVGLIYISVMSWFNPAFTPQKRLSVPDGFQYVIQAVNNVRLMNVVMILTCQQAGPQP